ncbi:MAG TPA: Asp-tRNA(Asn)/Glu-tRNA(Gln) amidotransferase subunit GatC [Chitinophagales bacterium]|jgi:aspartyl-tRNA(Asn)/glutamyl-tRNA(Gln) amidotransferase subunit C|nr:Asp-tRNA(Asn)/Glu-tRNA(Gln) amidotransferase subunit GatC [Chitinophagales bacterium]HQW79211.1 Asp-tRNA(Asn)/Glu-tRNA(Gln) amidotransferase subunit GatC [Chitinophagales bacterium]HRB67921.1 Asp-tRNA(Asn)/Glu-tRNA(Gln) amidotransferase subunit GatC [Chitinophagales bacterium]
MYIDDKTINQLSNLTKLEFDASQKESIKDDLNKILNFMEKLNELNTDGVQPLIYINEVENLLRDDTVHYPITKNEALMNAPLKNEDYIKVPKFVKGTKY